MRTNHCSGQGGQQGYGGYNQYGGSQQSQQGTDPYGQQQAGGQGLYINEYNNTYSIKPTNCR